MRVTVTLQSDSKSDLEEIIPLERDQQRRIKVCPANQELKEIMNRHGITRIVDVRSRPWTRRFSLKELEAAFGDSYISRPDMGGLDRAATGVVKLEELGREHRVLIICAEKSHRHCHRNYFVGRMLGEDGYGVRHL